MLNPTNVKMKKKKFVTVLVDSAFQHIVQLIFNKVIAVVATINIQAGYQD